MGPLMVESPARTTRNRPNLAELTLARQLTESTVRGTTGPHGEPVTSVAASASDPGTSRQCQNMVGLLVCLELQSRPPIALVNAIALYSSVCGVSGQLARAQHRAVPASRSALAILVTRPRKQHCTRLMMPFSQLVRIDCMMSLSVLHLVASSLLWCCSSASASPELNRMHRIRGRLRQLLWS